MTRSNAPPAVPKCPACGATIRRGTKFCWLCLLKFDAIPSPANRGRQSGIKTAPDNDYIDISLPEAQGDNTVLIIFGVLTLMTLAFPALELVSEGNTRGLMVALLVLGVLPFMRAAVLVFRWHRQGVAITAGQWIGAMLGSIGALALISVAAGVAFFAACFVTCLVDASQGGQAISNETAIAIASIAALAVVIPLFILFLKPKR